MSDTTMRPRKGDVFITLNNGETTVRMLLNRERVTPQHREVLNRMHDLLGEFLELPRAASPEGGNG